MDENGMSNILGALISKNGDAFGGANGSWVILFLFMMMAWGGGGGWGNNAALANMATQQDVFNGFNTQGIMMQLQSIGQDIQQVGYNNLAQTDQINQNVLKTGFGLQNQICNSGHDISMAIGATGNSIMNGIAQASFAEQRGTDGINRNIDQLRYEGALRTCDIKETSTANTQKIVDGINELGKTWLQNENQNLRDQLSALQGQLNTITSQGQLIQAIRPYPSPAYIVSSPYAAITTPSTGTTTG